MDVTVGVIAVKINLKSTTNKLFPSTPTHQPIRTFYYYYYY
jgi:hypothetical protein